MKWVLVAMLAIGDVRAQSPSEVAPSELAPSELATSERMPSAAPTPEAAPPACRQLCAGQPVELELLEPISSERHRNGDRFALRLAAPLLVDGVVVLPAGTTGIGEVVHASSSRAGGKPGELLLAARHLELVDGRVPLRAMKLAARGKDEVNASLATSVLLGPVGLFVHGREVEVPAGTRAQAKLASDLDAAWLVAHLPTIAIAPPPATPSDAPPQTPESATAQSPQPTQPDTDVSQTKE